MRLRLSQAQCLTLLFFIKYGDCFYNIIDYNSVSCYVATLFSYTRFLFPIATWGHHHCRCVSQFSEIDVNLTYHIY